MGINMTMPRRAQDKRFKFSPLERRQKARTEMDFAISLNYPPLGLLQARVNNISNSGVYVHSGTIRLNLYAEMEIIECINNTLVRALVTRITKDGAGLHFINPDPLLIQRLRITHLSSPAANDPATK